MGLLTASEGANLLNPDSWKETGYPILTSESVQGEYGPGHSCFSVDEDGREIFVYHEAKQRNQKCYGKKSALGSRRGAGAGYDSRQGIKNKTTAQ